MITNFNKYNKIFESDDFLLNIEVENNNPDFINKLIDKLSFVYKKKKDRYVRPINITGINKDGNIKLCITLSNKDKIDIKYNYNDDLKIRINGDTLYHMDNINKNNVIKKIYDIYSTYLKDNNFKISKKENPFEYFTEGLLNKLEGPSYEEIIKNTSVDELLKVCFNDLDEKGVEYALNNGASKELYYKLIEMKEWFIDIISGLKKVKSDKYPDSVFWKKDGEILFEQDLENMDLWVRYDKIWLVFEKKYGYKYTDIQLYINNKVEEHLNWKGFTPGLFNCFQSIRWNNI